MLLPTPLVDARPQKPFISNRGCELFHLRCERTSKRQRRSCNQLQIPRSIRTPKNNFGKVEQARPQTPMIDWPGYMLLVVGRRREFGGYGRLQQNGVN